MRDWTIRLLLLLLVAMPITMEAKEKDKPLIYEVSCGGSANQGFYLVKVKAVVDKKEIGDNILKRCAIHGVLFRGYSGGGGCISQPPMAGPWLNNSIATSLFLFSAKEEDARLMPL